MLYLEVMVLGKMMASKSDMERIMASIYLRSRLNVHSEIESKDDVEVAPNGSLATSPNS